MIVAEFAVSPDALLGGEVLDSVPGATIKLERVVPTRSRVLPFFWVFDVEPEAFLGAVDAETDTVDLEVLTEVEHGALFSAAWTSDADVVAELEALRPTILDTTGTAEEWWFQVRARDRERLAEFERVFTDRGLSVEVERVYTFAELAERDRPLTPEQREALLLAYKRGYFDQPREVTQSELGDRFGISGRAVSNRLRRGTKNLIANTLLEGSTDPDTTS